MLLSNITTNQNTNQDTNQDINQDTNQDTNQDINHDINHDKEQVIKEEFKELIKFVKKFNISNENILLNTLSNVLLTTKEIEDFKNELKEEPEYIKDIVQMIPPNEELYKIKNMINIVTREKITELFNDIIYNNINLINTNNNKFSSITKKEIIEYKIKKKIR